MTATLSIDAGGSGIKAALVDEAGTLVGQSMRIPTPYPLPPSRLIDVVGELDARLPGGDRITLGMPGMIRHGIVIATPHYITKRGPRSAVDPTLRDAWSGFDAQQSLTDAMERPTLVLNDAEIHGAGLVTGAGLEVVFTLGTGLGSAVFDRAHLAPHIELSHAPGHRGQIWDTYIGDRERKRLGDVLWSRRVRRMIEALRPVFQWDRLYLGGGNAQHVRLRQLELIGSDVIVVANDAALVGGARIWSLR